MKAILSIGNDDIMIIGSMRRLYHAVRQIKAAEPAFTKAIVWNDLDRMRWVFDVNQDGSLLITDMANNRPVQHEYGKFQFLIHPEVKA